MSGSSATSKRAEVVVSLSGGMDSTVCASLAARDYEVYALHFGYGQRTEAKELASAREIARLTGAKEFLPLKMDLFRRIGGSALTDETIAVPDAPAEEAAIGSEIPVTYVPFRNAHFLSAAVSWASPPPRVVVAFMIEISFGSRATPQRAVQDTPQPGLMQSRRDCQDLRAPSGQATSMCCRQRQRMPLAIHPADSGWLALARVEHANFGPLTAAMRDGEVQTALLGHEQ